MTNLEREQRLLTTRIALEDYIGRDLRKEALRILSKKPDITVEEFRKELLDAVF